MKPGHFRFVRVVATLVAISVSTAPLQAEIARHLFLDPAFIQQQKGVAIHVNAPQEREIIIHPDKPWEQLMISFFLTMLEENGKYRMWYICRDAANRKNVAYAESRDGIVWEKPNLGIVNYAGSTENNLVNMDEFEGNVFRDPNGKPGQEYAYVTSTEVGVIRYTSPDGLRWQRDAKPILPFRADTQNITIWDPRLGAYQLFLRGWKVEGSWRERLRTLKRLTLSDLSKPADVVPNGSGADPVNKRSLPRIVTELPTVLEADENDPPETDVYNLSAVPYPLDPNWYIGFPSFFERSKGLSDGRLEVQFAASHDGVTWQRYDRAPYAKPGLEGGESANVIYMGTGLAVHGDEIWQYGTGYRSRHGDMADRKKQADGVIRRYSQRVDGFVSLDFEHDGGSCVTSPVKITAERLELNIDTGALGSLQVGLVDESGAPIPGFGIEDCSTIRTNATNAEVRWKAGPNLTSLMGKTVRVSLKGARAKLYSFRFEPTDK